MYKIAYCLLFIAVILKSLGLYYLAGKKDKPFPERKRFYLKLNWSGNGLLIIGVVILAIKWFL
ncbi:MAG: hypothetical protein GXY91_01430 [Clostridia bacterium]|nr:hypothetical protein [Clostridia bacterium]